VRISGAVADCAVAAVKETAKAALAMADTIKRFLILLRPAMCLLVLAVAFPTINAERNEARRRCRAKTPPPY